MPGIYFLHDIFFYFLNEDNKRIISRRVFTFLIDLFLFLFHLLSIVYTMIISWTTLRYTSFCQTWKCDVLRGLTSSPLLMFTFFLFKTTMFLTEDLFIEGYTSSLLRGDVYTWKTTRSFRLKVSQTSKQMVSSSEILQVRDFVVVAAKWQKKSV